MHHTLVADGVQVGALSDTWTVQLRDAWQASLRNPNLTAREVSLHVLALQQFLTTTESPFVLTRAGFQKRINEARWAHSYERQLAACPLEPSVCAMYQWTRRLF